MSTMHRQVCAEMLHLEETRKSYIMKAINESDKVTRQEFWHVMDMQLRQHVLDKHDRDSHWMSVSLVDYQLVRSQPCEIHQTKSNNQSFIIPFHPIKQIRTS